MKNELFTFDMLGHEKLSNERASALAERARYPVSIGVGHATICVRFSRMSAASAFAERFIDAPGDGEPTTVAYAVDDENESYFWVSGERARRWNGPIDETLLAFFADTLAMHDYLTTSKDMGFHAAVVATDARLAAIVGVTTAGKTTTAIAAARRGLRLYSDERCIVQDGFVVPFLRAITVRVGGRRALLRDALPPCAIDDRLRAMPETAEYRFAPSALIGAVVGGTPRPLGTVFLIDGFAETPSLAPCPVASLLPELLRSMASRDRHLDRATRILRDLRDVRAFRLRLGAPDATARIIENALT